MADQRTLQILKKRKYCKALAFVLFGLIIGLVLEFFLNYRPIAFLLNYFQGLTVLFPGFDLKKSLSDYPFVIAPLSYTIISFGLYKLPWVTLTINRIFPDPPRFVKSSLDEAREKSMFFMRDRNHPTEQLNN